jgi:hypothetical protein
MRRGVDRGDFAFQRVELLRAFAVHARRLEGAVNPP